MQLEVTPRDHLVRGHSRAERGDELRIGRTIFESFFQWTCAVDGRVDDELRE